MNSHLTKEYQNGDFTKPDSTPRSLPNAGGFQTNRHNIYIFDVSILLEGIGNSHIPVGVRIFR